MQQMYILDPRKKDPLTTARGGGRFLQLIEDNIPEKDAIFVSNPKNIPPKNTVLQPYWFPFHSPSPLLFSASKKILTIFDVIPLKYKKNFPIGIKGYFYEKINNFLVHQYDEILTISEVSKNDIHTLLHIPNEKIKVCYLTVGKNLTTAKPVKPKVPLPDKFVLYVGDVNWNKNLEDIAYAVIRGSLPCVFVGRPFAPQNRRRVLNARMLNPWLHSYRRFLKIARDDKRFIFLENVDDNNLVWLYGHAITNILVSHDEGFGLSYIEAGYFKCPSILADNPIFHEIAGESALFVHPNKPDELAEKIQVLSSFTVRNNWGEKCFSQQKKYSNAIFTKSFLSITNDL